MEILKYDVEQLSKLLNITVGTLKVAKREGRLNRKLEEIGYKIVDTSKQGNKVIYHLIKEKEVEISYITKSKRGFIDLSDCVKEGNGISWKKSIGRHLRGEYKGIVFDFEIIGFTTTKNGSLKLKVLHNGVEKEMYGSDARSFKGFDMLLGIKSYEFLYEIGQRIKDDRRDFTIIDRKKDRDKSGHMWRYYKIHCNKCGFNSGEHYKNGEYKEEYWIEENTIKVGTGCACCESKICVTGINDMWTTNIKVAELLANEEDGYKYTFCTGVKLDFKCPYCDVITNKLVSTVNKHGLSCICNDNVKIPEKVMYSVLKQLNVEFIWQYTKTNAEWCGKYKYDFYFKLNDEEYIVETHGLQHYKSYKSSKWGKLENIRQNDLDKYNLAIYNGIKPENYIVIDFRKSTLEWGKSHILTSKLNDIFDLSIINWDVVGEFVVSNIYKDICNEWNKITEGKTLKSLCGMFNCSTTMISSALTIGNKLGWCDYNPKINYKNDIYIKVTDLDDNVLGVYRGYRDLQDNSKEQFGIFISHAKIYEKIIVSKDNIYGNLKIIKITKEEYEENKNKEFIKYEYKIKCIGIYLDNKIKYFKIGKECANFLNLNYNLKTSGSSVNYSCRNFKDFYGYKPRYYYLTEKEFNKI